MTNARTFQAVRVVVLPVLPSGQALLPSVIVASVMAYDIVPGSAIGDATGTVVVFSAEGTVRVL